MKSLSSKAVKKRIKELELECCHLNELLISKGQFVASHQMDDAVCGLHKVLSCWNEKIEWNAE